MITTINNLFSQLGFINSELEIGSLHVFEDINKRTYWLIIETDNLNHVIENQSNYFEQARNRINNEWFDKNVSLLILHKVEDFDNIQSLVLEIEENPYLFKKQVILYREIEHENLTRAIEAEENTIKDFIEDKILDEAIFKIHKESINNNDYESLLYRLAHKIPFIKLNIIQKNGLEALTDNNTQKIESGSYGQLNRFIEQNFFHRNMESVDEMESNTIYDLLLNTLSPDEN
ncbi:ABC-three component system middle component 1 [Chryseobacterium sp. MHB01]|uniref:ABC-three component system middle component 1 n=1 Tax=Chryseobacterium sp. MHB01 TaxID=3109433 RepID=UPI002AFF835C|nr:ABC-three component system middle component 1 [Chryseobacterium sp. MHB01]MEA1848161.1 ABC-three component system middle component 1 [Chryseobacterium sp. MHB01]